MAVSAKMIGHFGPLMGYCDHRIQTLMDKGLRPYNISPAQCRTLVYLREAEHPVNHRMLEQFLMVKPSTVNGIVCRLEEKGMIRRTTDEKDARCKYVSLTNQGEEFYETFCAVVTEVSEQLERGFSQEELDTLTTLLRRVAHNLDGEGECLC